MTAAHEGYLLGGRYRIGEVIGQGGMGTVWAAHDTLLDRPVAAKEVSFSVHLSDAQRIELTRLAIEEARSAARLTHPSIVAVYDVIDDGGRPWIVMQLVIGRSLEQAVAADGPMEPVDAARIGIDLLDALAVAHGAGIIHRDVKPSNVLIGPNGAAMLTDFSIARAVGAGTMTNTGMVMGSPGYIAPERIAHGQVTPAADLFGLGATLFFAVEGRGPFDAADSMAAAFAAAIHPHPRPEHAGALTPVIDGLLEKDPRNRLSIGDARSMLAGITGAVTGGTVIAGVGTPAPGSAVVAPSPIASVPASGGSASAGSALAGSDAATGDAKRPDTVDGATVDNGRSSDGRSTPVGTTKPSPAVAAAAPVSLNWATPMVATPIAGSGDSAAGLTTDDGDDAGNRPGGNRRRSVFIAAGIVIALVIAGVAVAQAATGHHTTPIAGPSPSPTTVTLSTQPIVEDTTTPSAAASPSVATAPPSAAPTSTDTSSGQQTTPAVDPTHPKAPVPITKSPGPRVTAITVHISKESTPSCQATINATVNVTAGPVTVNLSYTINHSTGTKNVTFGAGGAQSQSIMIGTGSDAKAGTAVVSATAPNSVRATQGWSVDTACLDGYTVSRPDISCVAGGGLQASVDVFMHNVPMPLEVTVFLFVNGNYEDNKAYTMQPATTQNVSLNSVSSVYSSGPYSVHVTVNNDDYGTIDSETVDGSC